MVRFWTLLFSLCFFGVVHATGETTLREHFSKVQPGDFVVTQQNRTYTLMLIQDRGEDTLLLEEISVPEGRFPRGTSSWREWVSNGAPGHTSWVAFELQPSDGRMLEYYSYNKGGWCDIHESENFFGTMLRLRLHPIEARHRRRVGSMVRSGQADQRPLWNPRLVVDGQQVSGVPFTAYTAQWPNDGGELAGKHIELYLPEEEGDYPSYFPYWLQVSGMVGKARLRILDSGKNLRSPRSSMPRRPLVFMNDGRLDHKGLHLFLHTRPYYGEYRLLAVETGGDSAPIPLEYGVQQSDTEGVLYFGVNRAELDKKLKPGRHYRFAIKSWKRPSNVAETRSPLLFGG